MKIRLLLLVAAVAAVFTGCATTPKATMTPEQGAATIRAFTSTGATLALSKNPKVIPVAAAIAAGVDVALAGNEALTAESIANYVKAICVKHEVSVAETAVFINLAQTVYNTYVASYKPGVVSAADPRVLLYANAFKNGLNDAVLAVNTASAG